LIKAGEFHCTKKDAEKFLYEIKDKKENAPMKGDPQKLLYWTYEFLPSIVGKREFCSNIEYKAEAMLKLDGSGWASYNDIAFPVLLVDNYYEVWQQKAEYSKKNEELTKEKRKPGTYGLANTGLSSERGQRAWKDIQRGVRKLLLDDKTWKNNDKGIENFTQAFYNYYLERQQEEMKEDSGAANKKCKKRKLEEDSDDESMVDWIQEVGAVEIV
jgi:hypothetical protein